MSSGSHLSKELFQLVKSIGQSKSKQEQDKIISSEVATLKTKIAQPSIPHKKMKENLLRAIYIEMLGHDASFAYIHAINLTQSSNIMCKRIGYLTCGLCLSPESQLLILLVAAFQRDLQSSNYLQVSGALSAICKLANVGMLHAINEPVIRLLKHQHEVIRKKAVMVLHRLVTLNPSLIQQYSMYFRQALCDKDPSVMGASLNFFQTILETEANRVQYKDLISSFVVILKQIIDHKLPRDYDYHRMPAPWYQIKLLEILATLGQDDQRASEQMYEILSDVMRRADDTGVNAGYAIVYQCLKTITQIYPNQMLIENAANSTLRFLTSDNHNLKYTGITGLISIVKINQSYAAQHQLVVVDCLEDPDQTLKRNTLNLLFRMTNPHNVRVIVDKLKTYLSSTSFDSHLKSELVSKITQLAEKYAPDPRWYLETINSIFQLSGEHVKPQIVNNLVRLIDEWRDDPDSIIFTIQQYISLLQNTDVVPDPLMQTAAWVMGEFGDYLGEFQQQKVMTILCNALHWRFENNMTKGWILTALLKLGKGVPSDDVRELVSQFSFSRNEDLQQRCYQFAGICTRVSQPLNFKENLGMNLDKQLSFLDGYVQQQLMNGARTYNSERNRRGLGFLISKGKEQQKASAALQNMKVNPYQAPRVDSRPVLISREPERFDEIQPVVSDLNIKERFWTTDGYVGNIQKQEPQKMQSAPSFNNPQPYKPSQQYTYQPRPQQKTQREIEKEALAKSIFGGLAPEEPQTVVRPSQPQQPKRDAQPQNLLDFQQFF